MTIALRQSGVTRPVVAAHFRHDGATKAVLRAWIRQSGALKKIFDEMSGALSPGSVFGYATSKGIVTVSTNSVTATVTGGVAPVTYAWAAVGSASGWTILNPSGATTNFSVSCSAGADKIASFQCTITDAVGQSVLAGPVSAECINDFGF